MKLVSVVYKNLKTKIEKDSILCKFKNDVDTSNYDVFFNQILSKENYFYPNQTSISDIQIISVESEKIYDFVFGTITLIDGTIINVDELKPLSSQDILFGLQHLYKFKNLKEEDIKETNLEISNNKILFLSQNFANLFLNLTHEDFNIYSAEHFEVKNKNSYSYVPVAVIKSLL